MNLFVFKWLAETNLFLVRPYLRMSLQYNYGILQSLWNLRHVMNVSLSPDLSQPLTVLVTKAWDVTY